MPTNYGLCSSDSSTGIPLEGVHVQAQVVDTVAQVSVVQFYCNNTQTPIEAKYVFPLDSNAAVTDFQAEIDAKIIVAHVKEKEEARREYNRALARGHGAYLLEEKTCEIFEILLGNIPPLTRVNVLITYIVELKVEADGSTRFFLPTAIAPRYTPHSDLSSENEIITHHPWNESWSDLICYDHFFGIHPKILRNPVSLKKTRVETIPCTSDTGDLPVKSEVPFALSCSIELQSPSKIVEVSSNTHHIKFESLGEEGLGGLVTFFNEKEPMDRDFVLNIKQEEPYQARAVVEVLPREEVSENRDLPKAVAMVTLVPMIELEDVKREIVFIIDRSGSMSGGKIKNVREAMQMFLRAIPSDCYFNIIGFGSSFEMLFRGKSVEYTNDTLKTATRHIDSLQADLGGTEVLKPLEAIFSQSIIKGYSRQIFLLTDGEVSNTDYVIQSVAKNCSNVNSHESTRVFTIGVGFNVSHALVEGVARAGHGTAEFIIEGERMEPKIMKQLKNALQPALTNVEVDWGYNGSHGKCEARNDKVYQSPYKAPPIFSGTRFTTYAFLNNHTPKEITVTAQSPDGPLTMKIEVETHQGNLLQKLAARALIRDLEEGTSHLHGNGRNSPSLDTVKKEIVKLGTTFSLASNHTSFLAIENRSEYDSQPDEPAKMRDHSPFRTSYRMRRLEADIDKIKDEMNASISAIISRGEKLEALRAQTDELSECSLSFSRHCQPKNSVMSNFLSWLGSFFNWSSSSTTSISIPTSQQPSLQLNPSPTSSAEPSSMAHSSSTAPVAAPPPSLSKRDQLQAFIRLQDSSGAFEASPDLLAHLNTTVEELDSSNKLLSQAQPEAELKKKLQLIWSTIVAIEFIELKFTGMKSEWELIVSKSTAWVKKALSSLQPQPVETFGSLQKAANELLK